MLTIKLEQFEGPLDLLLQLIEHEKLDVTRVSLSMVTDQYFESLSHLQSNLRIDELADFLVIASKLLLIKSHCLIPTPNQEDEQEIEELEKRLRLYREFVRAGAAINQLWNRHAELYTRPRPLAAEHISFSPPKLVSIDILAARYTECAKRFMQLQQRKPTTILFDNRISIGEKMAHIRALLSQRASFYFNHVVSSAKNKSEIIVSFLAILELIKQQSIVAHQKNLFSEISFKAFKS